MESDITNFLKKWEENKIFQLYKKFKVYESGILKKFYEIF